MQTIYFEKTAEIRRSKLELEEKLGIKIQIEGRKLTFQGNSVNEYEASIVLDAMKFGFSAKKALQLKDEEMIFRILNMKDSTRKKNLKEVRARVIGKQGRTKKTIENIANCSIIIRDNEVGIIGNAESIEETITGISNLIRGTKQSNAYKYLEKVNAKKRSQKER